MTARTVAIIQARIGSTRLPGKVLLPLLGRPILSRVVERTARARLIDEVVVATTLDPGDEAIVNLAAAEGWAVERGSENDLLDRYVQAARAHEADVVVRITSDCPLIDPTLIDQTIEAFVENSGDYASNTLAPRTYPRGLDVEVVGREALERAWHEDADPDWREHVTPYLYHHPEEFRLTRVSSPDDQSAHRWCVDPPEDYELVRRIYDELGRDDFTWRQALEIVESHPSWVSINRDVVQKIVRVDTAS
jgi:spore coat polysaccharide biosynthesis protein SpsF